MDDFIKMATDKLGMGESETRSATGGVLGMLKGQLGDGVFSQIAEKMPGAEALAAEAENAAPAEGGGGMLGGLVGKATSMLGVGGGAAGMMGMLAGSGMDAAKGGSFLTMFAEFVKGKVGTELWSKIAGFIPGVD